MALKFSQRNPSGSGAGGTYDHSLLVNRGLPDQHTIESITGLREALNRKYEKPMSGIPKKDLAFDVATLTDIDNLRKTDIFNLTEQVNSIINEIMDARGDKETLRQYIDSKVSFDDWSGAGGTGSNDGNDVGYPLYQEFFATEGNIDFAFTQTYRMGSRQLEVYLNGLRMVEGFDYIEVSENEIKFLYPLETNDHVLALVRSIITSGLHEEYVANSNQTLFKLASPYAIYKNILQVFRNGVLQRKGRDYREITEYIIEFYNPLVEGDLITFHQAGSTDPIAGTLLDSEIGRLKISNAFLSIQLQEMSGKESLFRTDMYADSFITTNGFDKESSFDFIHADNSIKTGLVTIEKNNTEEFSMGIAAGSDYKSLFNRVVLSNTNGGSEGNTFDTPVKQLAGRDQVTGYRYILLPNRSRIEIVGDKVELAEAYLRVVIHTADEYMNLTTQSLEVMDGTGSFHSFDHFVQGETAHIVFIHEKVDGTSAVFYMTIRDTGVTSIEQLSTYADKAQNPCIHVGDKVVIVFDSLRVHTTVRNIDYLIYDGNWSGVRHITSDDVFSSERPCVVMHDNVIYIAYDTLSIDGINRNIQMAKLHGDSTVEMMNVTALTFDNIKPRLAIGVDDIIRVGWLSKRLSLNYGVDFVFITSGNLISATRTVFSPTASTRVTNLCLDVDSQCVTHIGIEANEQSVSLTNIIYAYVTETNVVTQYGNIISHATDNIAATSISVVYDRLVIAGHSLENTYYAEKSLANYLSSGFYTAEYDGLSKDTKWLQFNKTIYVPSSTDISFEIRVSNDRYTWSEWESISTLGVSPLVGQYAQVRAHMTSNYDMTPEILSMGLLCEPNMIRVQTIPHRPDKDVQSVIVIAEYEGDVKFFVSRDAGETFVETALERTINLLGTSSTQELVLRAEIQKGSVLKSWALIW